MMIFKKNPQLVPLEMVEMQLFTPRLSQKKESPKQSTLTKSNSLVAMQSFRINRVSSKSNLRKDVALLTTS
uniref:Uncharacterized protein n=1 Tax=Caenorhabditis japonica TaxID=281687 RepID=A0A8R1IW28_CAEJA